MSELGGGGDGRPTGSWDTRVAFDDEGGFAYKPAEVLVRDHDADDAETILRRRADEADFARDERSRGSYVLFRGVRSGGDDDVRRAVEDLRRAGIAAQPNHVLFSHGCGCGCGCPPHPAVVAALCANSFSANPFSANPFSANPFSANPFSANPFSANPFSANPFSANPFSANPFSANPFSANPFSANPFSANPFSANPFSANDFQPNPIYLVGYAGAGPVATTFKATGRRPHSAHPAEAPQLPVAPGDPEDRAKPSIVVLDTGLAAADLRPHALTGVVGYPSNAWPPDERPDEDANDRIDPVAGHGTFIAGIIEQIAPGCELQVHGLLSGYGDATEDDVAFVLESLASAPEGPPQLLNLSFGGYALVEMARLGEAVRALQVAGTIVVASAGNDATCRPSFPAAFPDVVSVAALGPHGAAYFTNYGPWVRACAPGVDVVSSFFTSWVSPSGEDEEYAEWVRWSGTSFAAPAVVGALARAMRAGLDGPGAVEAVVDAPALLRLPNLGTVVNAVPRWRRA